MVRRRRSTRCSLAAAVACGLLVVGTGLAPTGAQEPPGETPATTDTTDPASPATTAPTPGGTPSDPATPEVPTPDVPTIDGTTTTTDAPAAGAPVPVAPPIEPSAADPADPAGLVLELAPGEQVVDGQEVVATAPITGSIYYAQVMQCVVGDGSVYDRCDLENGSYEVVGGTLRATVRLDAVMSVASVTDPAGQVDCRAVACEVWIETVMTTGPSLSLHAPLPFDPDAPLAPAPAASLTPAGPYTDAQRVTLRADGFVWDRSVQIMQCATGATDGVRCDYASAVSRALGPGETSVEATVPIFAVIDTGLGPVDCRVPGSCALAAVSGYDLEPRKRAVVPLVFDPATVVVPPTLTVTPAEGLTHGQVVTADGAGFIGSYIQFNQCATVDEVESCVWLLGSGSPDATGGFTSSVAVQAYVPTPAGEVDCRAPDAGCVLVASPGGTSSPRSGRAALHFAPDGPMPPLPTVTIEPASDLAEEASVTVTGRGFTGNLGGVELSVCQTGTTVCDESSRQWLNPTADGSVTTQLIVGASFTAWNGTSIDCRAEPGCSIVVQDGYDGRRASATLDFGDAPTIADRYRLPVFDAVDVTSGVVYRRATDAAGRAVDLRLSVHEPAGDTVERRPAVVWLDGGWFGTDVRPLTELADTFARRGYVSVTMGYRSRPGLVCCPTSDIEGVTAAAADATSDAEAGVRWLREHADEYGIDPDAIVIAGANGGAIAAFGVAHQTDAPVAAAVPVAGVGFGRPERGDPPFLAIHERYSTVAPEHLSAWACSRARRLGTTCATSVFDTQYGDLVESGTRSIAVEASAFVADVVLAPLGYTEPSGRDWGAPSGDTGGPGGAGDGPVVPVVPGAPLVTAVASVASGGRLPATGVTVGGLVAVAVALLAVGAGALALRRGAGARLARSDAGAARLWVAAGAAVVLLAAGFAVSVASGSGGDTDETAGSGAEQSRDDHEDHDSMDHDSMDHDSTDRAETDHSGMDHGDSGHSPVDHPTLDATDDDHGHDDHGGRGTRTSPSGHRHGGGGTSSGPQDHGDGSHTHDDSGTGSGHGGENEHGGTGTPGHEHPDPTEPGPSTPPHTHPDPTDPTDPDPPTGFDPSWTPEQVAFAEQLIADTQAELVRYDTLAILPLTGFQWIRDGKEVGTYQHWINVGRIADPRRLDATSPESLVLLNTADGPRLDAAMYMLSLSYHLGNIPADIAWLPGWHIHDNLCFENGYELVGVTVNGVCERGSVLPTPPMIHVWREPTECGWFAGVDEFGLQCDHEH